jgi:cytochrome P450
MLVSNPPTHARRRRPAARAFAFKLIQAWRPRIRALVSDMIDQVADERETDFLGTIASSLPSRLIAEIIGAPEQDAPAFAAMVNTMARGLGSFRPAEFEAIEAAAAGLTAYVERLLNERRRAPRDDFLSDYLRTVSETGELSDAETVIQIVSIIIGGSDTTRFGLTAMVSLLLQHRDQWDAVCADPGLASGAVLEALRFEPSVGSIGRVVTEPLSVDDVPFKPGAALNLSVLSAQRDEAVYAEPQAFNIARTDHPRWSVSFGMGPHRCLGEALARAEMEEALIVLSQRLPSLRLVGSPPTPKGHSGIRGITPMHVAWRSD